MLEVLTTERLIRRVNRALGYTDTVPQGAAFAERIADSVNSALGRVWAYARWPQLMRIERRSYRPPWVATVIFGEGMECFHGGDYYRARVENPFSEPGTNEEQWRRLDLGEVTKFISLDQPWENCEIAMSGLDLRRCVFLRDPKNVPSAEAIKGVTMSGDFPGGSMTRICLPASAPSQVWIAFMPVVPKITLEAWRAGVAYDLCERCYHRGDTWKCLSEGVTTEPGIERADGSWPWERQRVPEFMADALVAFARADFQEDDQGRNISLARAEQLLESLHETYMGAAGEFESVEVEA